MFVYESLIRIRAGANTMGEFLDLPAPKSVRLSAIPTWVEEALDSFGKAEQLQSGHERWGSFCGLFYVGGECWLTVHVVSQRAVYSWAELLRVSRKGRFKWMRILRGLPMDVQRQRLSRE